jgi:hypothetical protein
MIEESDHLALLVKVQEDVRIHTRAEPRSFKFEEMWTKHNDYEDMFQNVWQQQEFEAAGLMVSGTVLKMCPTVGSVRKEIRRLKSKLEDAKATALVSGSSQEVRDIENKYSLFSESCIGDAKTRFMLFRNRMVPGVTQMRR